MEKRKIKELFKYRRIPGMLKMLPKKKRASMKNDLMILQAAIYDLDQYLETHWRLNEEELESHWQNIALLMEHLGYSKDESAKMTRSIRRYQLHEMQLREGKLPTRLDPEYYYYYKSCDVRLMRQIILNALAKDVGNMSVTDWRYYDLITEINDDITDVFEDMETINGNLFLIKVWKDGRKNAVAFFEDLLDGILLKSVQRNHTNAEPYMDEIKKMTFRRYVETRELLRDMNRKLKKNKWDKRKKMIKRLEKKEWSES